MDKNYYAVIMAGGGGTRLWPLSRRERPKQMLKLFGENSLFQIAVNRLLPIFPPERILIITSESISKEFKTQCPNIPPENYIIEPIGRDTAAAIGLAAKELQKRNPDAVMAIVTADHFIENENKFRDVLLSAKLVAQDNYLVTLGIHPTFAATEFGYIQQGDYLGKFNKNIVFHAKAFKEKPGKELAEKLIAKEDHSWNSGMFIWTVEMVMQEFSNQMPELSAMLEVWGEEGFSSKATELWNNLKKISIDYGIMENAQDVVVIPAKGLGWNDVGSWNALFDVLESDEDGNIIESLENLNIESNKFLIHQKKGVDRMIVTIGVEDLVIVDTGDVLLVCDRHQSQKIRDVVKKLAEDKKDKYL